eukprot:TRINITY_DN6463_c0_g1_i2.p1 TRINITY_DN6463_c0_g1~~TRINITY_DN6463_c0_g1_i2.p1  ORF type:complete len:552 (-),score=217.16 TRINITY_DN6463_c0_g1_i2:103-1758(-)
MERVQSNPEMRKTPAIERVQSNLREECSTSPGHRLHPRSTSENALSSLVDGSPLGQTRSNSLQALSKSSAVRERDMKNAFREFDLPLPADNGGSGKRLERSKSLGNADEFNLEQPPLERAAAASRHTEMAAMVGTSLVTSSIKRDGKLLVAMVGVPARGKTFLSKSLKRHFDWIGLRSEIFSVVEYRRETVGMFQPPEFFSMGGTGEAVRLQIAQQALDDATQALRSGVDIAIYDAANTTARRRKWLVDRVRDLEGVHVNVIFVESVCYDADIIRENVEETKRSSPEYAHMAEHEAHEDLEARIAHYMAYYQPMDAEEGLTYIKLIDGSRQLMTNLISGYLPGKILMLLMNQHSRPRPIFMSRHGESEFNMQGRIGGNAPLTPAGRVYAAKLCEFMQALYPAGSDLAVWTSTMVRTGETVAPMTGVYDVVKWRALDEIYAGKMEGLTYEYVAQHMAGEYEARKTDKLNYRYPGRGESYQDVFIRLEPVMFEMLRCRTPLLIIGHQAILRVLYAYLKRHTPQECPTLAMPLHTVIKLTPRAYSCDEVSNFCT